MRKILPFLFFLFSVAVRAQTVKTDLVYLVNQPAIKSEKPPVLIFLHGYGSNEKDIFNMVWLFDQRFLTFSLRGPNPVPNAGYCWYGLEFLPHKKFKYNPAQSAQSRDKILSFIREACKTYHADSNRVFILGFSQGAMMAHEVAAGGKIKGVVALSGFITDEAKKTVTDLQPNTSYFIAHGNRDNVVDYNDGKASAEFLESKKLNVTFKTYAMAHIISNEEIKDVQAWMKTNLGEAKKTGIKQN